MRMEEQRAPSLQNDIKFEDSQFESAWKMHRSRLANHKNNKELFFQQQSQANWQINHRKRQSVTEDTKSVSSELTGKGKREPTEQDLCKAILCLRKRYPQRSIEQIVIRLYQAACLKKDFEDSSIASKNNYLQTEFSRADDFEERETFAEDFQKQNEVAQDYYASMKNDNTAEQKQAKSLCGKPLSNIQEIRKKEKNDCKEKKFKNVQVIYDYMVPEAGVNYIYKPKGKEVVVQFRQRDTFKKKFINIQQETRYLDRRVMAKSFIQRGYGVSQCRKEIQAQGVSVQMHRNTYKTLAGSVIILAFRKLESFIANECSKTIKFLDRWQMRAICTNLLNCRVNMQPELITTLFKFIKAGYGLGDVTIGEIQAVKLYLACQKYIYGKYVTMQSLQRLGEVQHKKNIEMTLNYLNKKKVKKQQRLVKLRKRRLKTRVEANTGQNQKQAIQTQGNEDTLPNLSQIIKIQDRFDTDTAIQKIQEISNNNEQFSASFQLTLTPPQSETSVPSQPFSESTVTTLTDVKEQEKSLTESMDQELAYLYLKLSNLQECKKIMIQKYVQLMNWDQEKYAKRFEKVLKKSIKKVQEESQIIGDPSFPVLNKLQKSEVNKIIRSAFGEVVRKQLLEYFILDEPNLTKLKVAVNIVNSFLGEFKVTLKQEHRQIKSTRIGENTQNGVKIIERLQKVEKPNKYVKQQINEKNTQLWQIDQQVLKIEHSEQQPIEIKSSSCFSKEERIKNYD